MQKRSDDNGIEVDFIAVDELLRRPDEELSQIDQEYLVDHARYIGIKRYAFTKEEYERLRNLAEKLHLNKQLVQELDKDYSFAYRMTRKVRLGAINSIGGMCYDIAIRNYAQIASTIKRKSRNACK